MFSRWTRLLPLTSSFFLLAACATNSGRISDRAEAADAPRSPALNVQPTTCRMVRPYYASQADSISDSPALDSFDPPLKARGYNLIDSRMGAITPAAYVLQLQEGESGILMSSVNGWRSGYTSLLMVTRREGQFLLAAVLSDPNSGSESAIQKLLGQVPKCRESARP